jgi:glucose-6-phosphate isomerase
MSGNLIFDTRNMEDFIEEEELDSITPEVKRAHELLSGRTGPGKEFLGWMDLPGKYDEAFISEISDAASSLSENSDVVVVIGIGGSYLGAKALIDAVCPREAREKIVFSGYNICGEELEDLLAGLKEKDFSINVISKSGTTTESAIAFRAIESLLIEKYGKAEAKKRVVCTTDKNKGALREISERKGYRSFVIPDDVGGRFSVLTPVGLFPAAAAGVDIRKLLSGARAQKESMSESDPGKDPAALYASIRNILWRKGKTIEVFSVFDGLLRNTAEWWQQLFGESEGKNGRGIFPAGCVFSTDLHSMGQLIQDGNRNIFETFLTVERSASGLEVPFSEDNTDGLNYISGMRVDDVNRKAYEATRKAHFSGGVPNSTISIEERSAFCMGQLFYFFETAVSLSAYISGVNPFDQPGVEAYKKEMFRLLGKNGTN